MVAVAPAVGSNGVVQDRWRGAASSETRGRGPSLDGVGVGWTRPSRPLARKQGESSRW